MGMLWMMPAGWLNHLLGAAWRARKALSEGRLMGRTNKFTLLDAAGRVLRGCAGKGWGSEAGRAARLLGQVITAANAVCLA